MSVEKANTMDTVAISITFEQLLEAVAKLSHEQKTVLADRLQLNEVVSANGDPTSPTENQQEARRKPRFAFVNPDAPELSEDEMHALLHEVSSEWKQEFIEYHGVDLDADD